MKNKTAFIFHGSAGSNKSHWLPWIGEELEKDGFEVVLPQFPVEDQDLKGRLEIIEQYKEKLEDSIMIGHSLGVATILHTLQEFKPKIKAAFLVAGFTGSLKGHYEPYERENVADFSERDFDWQLIKQRAQRFSVFHSDNDSAVPLQKGEELAQSLHANFKLIKNAGHFCSRDGYNEFSQLLREIKKEYE